MTITLDLDIKNEKLQDEKLSIEIKKSEELNTLLSKVKM